MQIVRVFLEGVKIREVSIEGYDFGRVVVQLVKDYPDFAERLHMIEVEEPGAPLEERFCRFGSDHSMMVAPVGVRLPLEN